jgi:hypothetical protein
LVNSVKKIIRIFILVMLLIPAFARADDLKNMGELLDKGLKLFDNGQYEEAYVPLDEFLSQFDQGPPQVKEISSAQIVVSNLIATQVAILFKQGKWNKAIAKVDENQQRFGKSTDPKVKETLAHGAAAKELMISEKAKKAPGIYPKEIFDVAQARSALEAGNATIKGRVCAFHDGRVFTKEGVVVTLFPQTPYLDVWKKLRDSKKGVNVIMSDEAISLHREVKTQDNGYYNFSNIKSGKYFLQVAMQFVQAKSSAVYDGSDQYGNTRVDNYHEEVYGVDRAHLLEDFVEITKDGEVKTVNLYEGSWLNRAVNIDCR